MLPPISERNLMTRVISPILRPLQTVWHLIATARAAKPLAVALLLTTQAAVAQDGGVGDDVRYRVDLTQAPTQRAFIEMTFSPPEGAGPVAIRMPAWRPGRYVILDPAGGVVQLTARDARGRALDAQKLDKATWSIERGTGAITVEYELYANSLGLRTRHIDDTHAFLSGSAVFLYVDELRDLPHVVSFVAPADWRVAGGLEPTPDPDDSPRTLVAPSYDVLIDSPIEIGLHDRIDFDAAGKPHEIIIWPPGRRYDEERLVADFTELIEEQLSIFGELPFDRYVFLVHAGAGAGGGTEHLNSTIMQVPSSRLEGSLTNDDDYRRFLGLVSHEFFHTWNVKQMRPSSMAPYTLQSENYSTLFWVAEGTTSYYDTLTLARAGLIEPKKALEDFGDLIDGSRNNPGAMIQSLSDSSYDAWVKFNRRNPDTGNTTVSFYSQGALASWFLDLQIRAASSGATSLDDVLRDLFERHPLQDGGYSRDDLEQALRRVTGRDWSDYFRDYIDGTRPLPFEDALSFVGLELIQKPNKPKNGAQLDPDNAEEADDEESDQPPRSVADTGVSLQSSGDAAVVRTVRRGSALYAAGILPGDEIIAIDGRRIDRSNWSEQINMLNPGQSVRLHYVRHGELRARTVTVGERLDAKWALRRVEEPTADQKAAYSDWLGQPWPESEDDA